MDDILRSTLSNKTGKLVGFGFDKHPEKNGWWIHLVFYWIRPAQWVICMGDVKNPDPDAMRPNLGDLVPGELFAAYAQRNIDGLTDLEQFKEIITDSFPHIKFEWWCGKPPHRGRFWE